MGKYLGVETGLYTKCMLNSLENCQDDFQRVYAVSDLGKQYMRDLVCSTSLQTLGIGSVDNFSYFNGCIGVSH